MRKFLTLMMALIMVLGAVGCGNKKTSEAGNDYVHPTIDFLCDDTKAVADVETKAENEDHKEAETKTTAAESETNKSNSAQSETKKNNSTQSETKKNNATQAETKKENVSTDTSTSKNIDIKDLTGKTLKEALAAGYENVGYMYSSNFLTLYLRTKKANSDVTKLKNSIQGKTISEIRSKYDFSIGYLGMAGQYIYYAEIGSVTFHFELDNGKKAIEAHKGEAFFDLEEAEELQNDTLKNLSVGHIEIEAEVDGKYGKILSECSRDEIDKKLEELESEIVIKKIKYELE